MARQLRATEVRVPCRISYAHVVETDKNGVYSCSLLIPKTDKKTLLEVNNAVEAAINDGKSKLANKDGAINKKMLKLPLRDADEEGNTSSDYKGMMFFNAKSKRRPQIVNRHNIFNTLSHCTGNRSNILESVAHSANIRIRI